MAGTTHKYVDGNLTVVGNLTVSGTATSTGTQGFAGNIQVNGSTSTSAAGAVTLNNKAGIITTETLTTISQAIYTLTISNSVATVGDHVYVSVSNGTNTTGIPVVTSAACGAGTVVVKVANASTTTSPFGGTLKIDYLVFKN
jgi:hypothetical protein